jgi:hypothetical protein
MFGATSRGHVVDRVGAIITVELTLSKNSRKFAMLYALILAFQEPPGIFLLDAHANI